MIDPRESIRSFIAVRFPQIDLEDAQDIFELGFVNSLFATELVMFIENTFDFLIDNDDLVIENFRTVDAMVELVSRHTAVTAA